MNVLSLFSSPSGRRKIPDPCFDFPQKIGVKDKNGFRLETFDLGKHAAVFDNAMAVGAWDATPHITCGRKIALEALAKGKPCRTAWEEQIPGYKRQIVHIESLWGANIRQAGGVPLTPSVVWGILRRQKFPGETSLCEDQDLADKHLETVAALGRASGREEPVIADSSLKKGGGPLGPLGVTATSSSLGVGAGEGIEIPPPGTGIGYFSWLKEIIPGVQDQGPLGRGWGRITEDKRSSYPTDSGRMDPGCVRIRGFVFATTDGHAVHSFDLEKDALDKGFRVLEIARFSTNIIVEDARAFKSFTLGRAASCGVVLPSWILFPHGRAWLSDLRTYSPPLETDPLKWILRCGVSRGLKTCSNFIVEPSQGLFPEDGGNPSITAKSILGAVSVSPYFSLGNDRAPNLWRG